jgi:hypothetical protein
LGTCDTTFIGDGHGQFGADCWVESPLDGQAPGSGSCGVITDISRYERLPVATGESIVMELVIDEVLFERSGMFYDSVHGDGGVAINFSAVQHVPAGGLGSGSDGAFVAAETDPGWPRETRYRLEAGGCDAEDPLPAGEYLVQAQIHTGLNLAPGSLPDTGRAHARAIAHVESLQAVPLNCA